MKHNQLLKGTLILTFAGLATRVLGFFYRIFLSNVLGAKNLGIYQLIFPIYGICYTIYASGIQTAISSLIASDLTKKKDSRNRIYTLIAGMCLSLILSIILSALLYLFSDYIALVLLNEASSSKPLKILSLVFPFCGVTSCINGYYYGLKKTIVPAFTQFIEQIFRVISVYIIVQVSSQNIFSSELAVLALVIGELISCIFSILSLKLHSNKNNLHNSTYNKKMSDKKNNVSTDIIFSGISKLVSFSFPLTANKLLISILSSVESILIPAMLRKYGLSHVEALSIYGILTGMSMSIIFFPSTITNSLSVVLLPTISEADSIGKHKQIATTSSNVVHYCLLIGILCVGIFSTFGVLIGKVVFNNELSGSFIASLAWLCPFMYINTTLSSILNGLSKVNITFINSIIGISLRIIFIIILVPAKGIYGYLIGLLLSTIIISLLDYFAVKRLTQIAFNSINSIVKPSMIIIILSYMSQQIYLYTHNSYHLNELLLLFIICVITSILYIIILYVLRILKR